MTLPVSSYEELLNRVRSLTHETRQLQRQIDAPLLDHNENERQVNSGISQNTEWGFKPRTDRDLEQVHQEWQESPVIVKKLFYRSLLRHYNSTGCSAHPLWDPET